MQKTPKETLSKLAKALNQMSIEPTQPSKEQTTDATAQSNQRISEEEDELFQMYVKVYDTYHNDYPKNGKGFVCYYKDVLQHLNEKIDIYNAEVETRWREAEVEAVNKATADAANNSKDEKKARVTKAVQDVPEKKVIPRSSLGKMVEKLERYFKGAVLQIYFFMIEEDIEFNLDEKDIRLRSRQPPHRRPQQQKIGNERGRGYGYGRGRGYGPGRGR